MNPKFLFIAVTCAVLAPFILASVLMDLSRRQAVSAALVGASLLLLISIKSCRTVVVEWLGSSTHVVTILLLAFIAVSTWGASQIIARKRDQSQLRWRVPPTQREFAISCVKYLQAAGWIYRTGLSSVFVDICRLEKRDQQARFLFSAGDFQIDTVQRVISELRSTPFGKTIVVTLSEPSTGIISLVEQRGWHIIKATDIDQIDNLYEIKNGCPHISA